MKRIAIVGAAAIMSIAPFAASAAEAQHYRSTYAQGRDHHDRWDARRHNGFFLGGRFHYGEPNRVQRMRHDYRPAYREWRRGDRMPAYYRSHYREVDWRREQLRAPPRGYHYVRTDRGETLLVGVATGVILGLILSN